jgi:hypothetical protein
MLRVRQTRGTSSKFVRCIPHCSDNIAQAAPKLSRRSRRRTHPVANLQPGIVAVTTTAATTSSASFLPARPSPAIRDPLCDVFRYCAGRSEVLGFKRTKGESGWMKTVNACWIVNGILVARHRKTPEDLGETRLSPRTECLTASAVQWADRIMTRIDGVYGNSPGNGKR